MGDVQAHGSQQVPKHLQTAANPLLKRHGIGVGYKYPHDYENADIEQQYLPDALKDRVYYRPSDQGMEAQIAARLERLAEARAAARESGGAKSAAIRGGTRTGDPMRIAGKVMRDREEVKRRTAEKQKKDASADPAADSP
jgi:putative ATPase